MVIHDNSEYFHAVRMLPKRIFATCLLAVFAVCTLGITLATRLQDSPMQAATSRNRLGIEESPFPFANPMTAHSKQIPSPKIKGV